MFLQKKFTRLIAITNNFEAKKAKTEGNSQVEKPSTCIVAELPPALGDKRLTARRKLKKDCLIAYLKATR